MTEFIIIADLPFGSHYLKIIKDVLPHMGHKHNDGVRRKTISKDVRLEYDMDNGWLDISVECENCLITIDTDHFYIINIWVFKSDQQSSTGINSIGMNIFVKAISSIYKHINTKK